MMVQLNRSTQPLLRTVYGKPHAGNEHHEKQATYDASPEGSTCSEGDEPDPSDMQDSFARSVGHAGKVKSAAVLRKSSLKQPAEGKAVQSPKRSQIEDDNLSFDVQRPAKRKRFAVTYIRKPTDFITPPVGGLSTSLRKAPVKFRLPPPCVEPKTHTKSASKSGVTTKSGISSFDSLHDTDPDDDMAGAEEYVLSNELGSSDNDELKDVKDKSYRPRKGIQTSTSPSSQCTIPSSNPERKVAKFRMPMTFTQMAPELADADLGILSRTPSPDPDYLLPDEGECPMRCGKMLPRVELEALNVRANIRQMQRFCRDHQVRDAEEVWNKRRFPAIDWDGLKGRLKRYDDVIRTMIEAPEHLFFRKQMAERVKTGKDRSIMQHMKSEGLDSIGVGYYGPRGLDDIMDYITHTFSTEIRARAGADKLIAARSPSGYIQMVLVPEVATLMVQDDMAVDAESARQIMRESNHVGELLSANEAAGNSQLRRARAEYVELED